MARKATAQRKPSTWQDRMYDMLREHGVDQFAYVPDAGHKIVINRCLDDPDAHAVALTTEEEGVALAAGANLGDGRAVVLMQSSGVGNCVNFLSMLDGAQFPFLTIVSMRGEFGEGHPWQMSMGQAVEPVLETMGINCLRIEREEDVEQTIQAALTMVFKSEQRVAVLLTQRLLGAKAF